MWAPRALLEVFLYDLKEGRFRYVSSGNQLYWYARGGLMSKCHFLPIEGASLDPSGKGIAFSLMRLHSSLPRSYNLSLFFPIVIRLPPSYLERYFRVFLLDGRLHSKVLVDRVLSFLKVDDNQMISLVPPPAPTYPLLPFVMAKDYFDAAAIEGWTASQTTKHLNKLLEDFSKDQKEEGFEEPALLDDSSDGSYNYSDYSDGFSDYSDNE